MNINHLFPTPVAFFDLGRTLTEEELAFVEKQERRPNMGNTTSTDNTILKQEALKSLNDFIEASVQQYFKEIHAPKHKVDLRITQSWLNYTKPGEYHHKHEHPNSFISGVFYINADPEKDKIYFFRSGYQTIKLPPADWNLFNSDSWWFGVETGKLVLFPSSLTHMVETKQGENTRISLAFNTFPAGTIGETLDLTGLTL